MSFDFARPAELADSLGRALSEIAARTHHRSGTVTGAESDRPQILLVDDNPTNLQVLYQTLEGHGYRLLAARSGKDAIAIAQRAFRI